MLDKTKNEFTLILTIVNRGFADPVKVIDSACKNNRILTIDIDNPLIAPEKLKRRVETERNRRRENRTTVTVHGWGLTDAQIKSLGAVTEGKEVFWVPNLLRALPKIMTTHDFRNMV